VDRKFFVEFVEGVPYLAFGVGELGQAHFP
jgi:hypothetical protein